MDKKYIYKKVQNAVYAGEVVQAESKETPIKDWSPNNLRKLILSPEGVVTQWYTIANTKHKAKTQIVLFKDMDESLFSLLNAPHNFLKVLSQHHKFSNIEEIIILPHSPERPGMVLDVTQILNSLDIKSASRLANIIVGVEPIALKEFTTKFKDTINKPTDLLGSVVTPDLFSVKQLNVQYYNSINLRGFYYDLDKDALSKYLKNIKKKFDSQIDTLNATEVTTKETLERLIARNNLLNPLIDDALLIYMFFLKHKQFGIIPTLPEEKGFFGLSTEKPKGLAFLKKAHLVTETPSSNIDLLNSLNNSIQNSINKLLSMANLESMYDLDKLSIKESLPKIREEILPTFAQVNKKESITRSEDYIPMGILEFEDLKGKVLLELTKNETDCLLVWNSFVINNKLRPVEVKLDETPLSKIYEKLPRQWQEYIGYNILLNSSRPELYASQDEPKQLLLTAVPAKHYKIEKVEKEELTQELMGTLDLRANYDFTDLPDEIETSIEGINTINNIERDTELKNASDIDTTQQDTHTKNEINGVNTLSDKQKELLDIFKRLPIRKMWLGINLNENLINSFITQMGPTSDINNAVSAFVILVYGLRNTGEGVLAYIRDKHSLTGSITAVGDSKYSGISSKTMDIVKVKGTEPTWEDILKVSQILVKDERKG